VPTVHKSGNLKILEPSRPVQGLHHLYCIQNENSDLLGYYASSSCNLITKFRGSLSIPSSRVKNLTSEDGKWHGMYGLTVDVYELLFVINIARIYPEDRVIDSGFKTRE
jgi:hypothetical protein